MKKILAILLAALFLLSLAACGSKPATPDKTETEPEQDTGKDPEPAEDPAEYSQEYWEEKYPGENVCPFYIEIDGVEYPYYRVSGLDEGTMKTWVDTPLNWDGWHLAGEYIISKDDKHCMTEDWMGDNPEQSFSSGCVVTTEPFEWPSR